MAAERWTQCPRCIRRSGDFTSQSLREDCHIGMDADGKFEVGYVCECEECGFRFTFGHKAFAEVGFSDGQVGLFSADPARETDQLD
jgi:hypothetical protein